LIPGGQFHPIHEIPQQHFLDGALVGACSLKLILVTKFGYERFMQNSFYIFMNAKSGLPNMPYINRLLVIIHFVIKDAQIHFSLFIHIMYAIL
jgi:hypothetical protein